MVAVASSPLGAGTRRVVWFATRRNPWHWRVSRYSCTAGLRSSRATWSRSRSASRGASPSRSLVVRSRGLGAGIRRLLRFSSSATRGSIGTRRASCACPLRWFPRKAISSSIPPTPTFGNCASFRRRRFGLTRDLHRLDWSRVALVAAVAASRSLRSLKTVRDLPFARFLQLK
jgi:hypothetical protein